MSKEKIPPPFLADPPIYNNFFKSDGKTITTEWKNWLSQIPQVMGYVIVHDFLASRTREVALLQVPSFTTSQRNSLDNARDGTIIYDTDLKRTIFRENGAWVTFTSIPA